MFYFAVLISMTVVKTAAATNLASDFFYLWLGWGAGFAIIEGIALYLDYKDKVKTGTYVGGTLSELVWRSTRTGKAHFVIAFIFTVFWVWLTYHFFLAR